MCALVCMSESVRLMVNIGKTEYNHSIRTAVSQQLFTIR